MVQSSGVHPFWIPDLAILQLIGSDHPHSSWRSVEVRLHTRAGSATVLDMRSQADDYPHYIDTAVAAAASGRIEEGTQLWQPVGYPPREVLMPCFLRIDENPLSHLSDPGPFLGKPAAGGKAKALRRRRYMRNC